jgi:Asp-tRNA(Asn)/Glu-tRNA(Gln) amidotransferase A subunit family amidase
VTTSPGEADRCNAFLSFCSHEASGAGPLAGLTVAVKDNIAVKGQPFTAGLPLFAGRVAETDAAAVRRLKDAGARVVGVTRTDAGGLGVTTPDVKNPVLPGHVVGGSSGGSAAAVAAGLADIGLGTDTGGSVRIPAACCGLTGFKPSHGRVPLDGVWPLAPQFDTVGLMTRDSDVLARAAHVLFELEDAVAPPSRELRLGIDRARLADADPVIAAAIAQALSRLADAGVAIVPVALPDRDYIEEAHGILVLMEARTVYADTWHASPNLFPPTARRALDAAAPLSGFAIEAARRTIAAVTEEFAAICRGVDAIVTPTLPAPVPASDARRIRFAGQDVPVINALLAETSIANVTGGPAIAMPCPAPGTLASLQLLAPRGHDARLLAVARRIEAFVAPSA